MTFRALLLRPGSLPAYEGSSAVQTRLSHNAPPAEAGAQETGAWSSRAFPQPLTKCVCGLTLVAELIAPDSLSAAPREGQSSSAARQLLPALPRPRPSEAVLTKHSFIL